MSSPVGSFLRAIFLLHAITVGLGCGDGSPEKDKVHLVFAVAAGMSERPKYQAAVDEFTRENPNVHVQILEIPGNYYKKLTVMIAGGNPPDLMWMGSGFAEFAQRDLFLDLGDRIARDIDPRLFPPQTLDWYRFNGNQFGIPFGIDLYFVAFNKSLFDARKVAYPTSGWNYSEFLDKAQKLTVDEDGDGRIDHYGFRGEMDISLFAASTMSEDGQRAFFATPQVLDYLQVNLDLVQKYHVSPPGSQLPNLVVDDPVSVFRQGGAAMMIMATWDLPFLRERCRDMDWDITTNPVIRRPAHWASSQAVLISRTTKQPELAWTLAKKFLGESFQRSMADRVLPSNQEVARKVVLENSDKPHNLAALIKATNSMYRIPSIPNMTEIGQLWFNARQRVFSGRTEPTQAMVEMQKQVDRLIRDRKRLAR